MQVDLGLEPLLSGMRRAQDVQLVVLGYSRFRVVGVVWGNVADAVRGDGVIILLGGCPLCQ